MKRRICILTVVTVLAFTALSCFCGNWFDLIGGWGAGAEEQERPIIDVTGVHLATSGTLIIEVGDTETLYIEAPESQLWRIKTEVRNGKLRIYTRSGSGPISWQPVYYYLTVKELDTIEISGSGDVQAPDLETAGRFSVAITGSGDLEMGDLKAEELKVRLTGSGDMAMEDLYADEIEVDLTGSGQLDISGGSVEAQDITVSGSGEYQAMDLESTQARVRLTGSGDVTVQV